MIMFFSIFALGVAALLGAQRLDIECAQPRQPVKISRPAKSAAGGGFSGAVTQS